MMFDISSLSATNRWSAWTLVIVLVALLLYWIVIWIISLKEGYGRMYSESPALKEEEKRM